MNNYEEFHRGVQAFERGDKCPPDASEPFQRGYGIGYASSFMQGDIEREVEEFARRNFDDDFNRIFGGVS